MATPFSSLSSEDCTSVARLRLEAWSQKVVQPICLPALRWRSIMFDSHGRPHGKPDSGTWPEPQDGFCDTLDGAQLLPMELCMDLQERQADIRMARVGGEVNKGNMSYTHARRRDVRRAVFV